MLNLDTHVLIHALTDNVTPAEKKILSQDAWSISGIVLWEIYKLHQIGRIELEISKSEFQQIISNIHIWNLDLRVFKALSKLDFKSDPANEIIAATSLAYNIPLLTRDKKSKKSKIVPLA